MGTIRLTGRHTFLALAGLCVGMVATANASVTICVGGCSAPTIAHDVRQYSYSGYLQNLTVGSSQTLPVSVQTFYQLVNPDSATTVPVNFSLNVDQMSSGGYVGYNYGYSLAVGDLVIQGRVDNVYAPSWGGGISGFAPSPFVDDTTNYDGSVSDRLRIIDTDFNATSGNAAVDIASRSETPTPGTIQGLGSDKFYLDLLDLSATALNSEFPIDGIALESMFPEGVFGLSGDIELVDEFGNVVVPFSDELFGITGTFSSTTAPFNPTSDQIGKLCHNLANCGGVLIPIAPVPLPGAALLFCSGLTGLGGLARWRQKRQ